MNQPNFEYELQHAEPPAPSPQARLDARRAALAEFERVHAVQGATRAAGNRWWTPRSGLWAGLAAACLAVIGISIGWFMPVEQRRPQLTAPTAAPAPNAPPAATAPAAGKLTATAPRRASPAAKNELAKVAAADAAAPPAPAAAGATATGGLSEVVVTGARTMPPLVSARAVEPGRAVDPGMVIPAPSARGRIADSRDRFAHFEVNPVKRAAEQPVSTFSIDVDTASYSYVRRQLNGGVLPQQDAVRAEEMLNYFDYAWPAADSREQPFRSTVTVSDSPWGKGKKLVHIGIKGYELPVRQQPDVNLVLLLDVSGSMNEPDKLPLAQRSMALLLDSLKPTDTVAIAVYAGAAGEVLPPTPVSRKEDILRALYGLTPGGSTAGAAGIRLAYDMARRGFRKDGVNRILLATDGDFNVGISDSNELKSFVAQQRRDGVYLSVLGFGAGNYRDDMAQVLAQNGNGVAAYIDTLNEARKVLVQEAGSTLFTIAKDVKIQVEFNPATVAEYRLIGYETRALNREDFNNDKVDAGDIGSGHTVTAIYEITPVDSGAQLIDERRYGSADKNQPARGRNGEYGYLKIRYKLPGEDQSRLLQAPIAVSAGVPAALRQDVEFSTAVAGFAQLLQGGRYTGGYGYGDVLRQAQSGLGADPHGYRAEFLQLVRRAQSL